MTTIQSHKEAAAFSNLIRIGASLLGIGLCLLFIFLSARFGFSRVLSRYSVLVSSLEAGSEAVRLGPSDPDAHRAKAAVFRNFKMYKEAARELELATSLRPLDDYLWLELGGVREELDDQEGALRAFDRAVVQAPYYAHTHWQRANLLLRMGRYDEAFPELVTAAKSNRTFLPRLIDLAWGLSKEDPTVTQQLAGISESHERIAFARFLARRGKGNETVEQFRLVKTQISEDLKRELVRELVSFHAYREAYQIWAGTESNSQIDSVIHDGGFEGPINFGEVGFGWIIPREQPKIIASVDSSDKDSGDKSLRIVFDGNSNSSAFVVSQTIIVKPQHRYRINFAVKTKDIVTGGLPLLSLTDGFTGLVLERSSTLQLNSASWEKRTIEFTAPAGCEAVVLKLVRNECQSSPCPIFGVLWLDTLSIEDLKTDIDTRQSGVE